MATGFRHNDVVRASKAVPQLPGLLELPVPCSVAAYGAQVHPVNVAEHLNAMIATLGNHHIVLAIERNAARRKLKLSITSTFAADEAHEARTRT